MKGADMKVIGIIVQDEKKQEQVVKLLADLKNEVKKLKSERNEAYNGLEKIRDLCIAPRLQAAVGALREGLARYDMLNLEVQTRSDCARPILRGGIEPLEELESDIRRLKGFDKKRCLVKIPFRDCTKCSLSKSRSHY